MAIINGDGASNNLFGTNENDQYFGFGAFDLLFASLGNDTLDGGSDTDVAIYDVGLFSNGVFINNSDTAIGTVLAHTVDKRGFGTDTLIDVSNFHGSETDDIIHVGGSGGTYTFDKAGNDLVFASQDPNAFDDHNFLAGSGNDTLIGTVNRDEVDYRESGFDAAGPITQGVDVDLASGVAIDGWGDTDTLISIERVEGTQFDDTIRGDDGRNDFEGFQGDDFFDGRGGDDDRVRYDEEPGGIDADLAAGTVIDGYGDTDTLVNIERITGSQQADIIRGDDNNNDLVGKGGADLIEGRGGDDYLEGGAGDDTVDGGAGDRDRISYDNEDGSGAVIVNLTTGVATDSFGDTDTLSNIERVDGTQLDDVLIGDDNDNELEGEGGNDTIEGRGGDDFIDGQEGNDSLLGGDGRDTFRPGQGDDFVDGGASFAEFSGGDRVRYDQEHEDGGTQGINVDLIAGTATDTFGNTDTLVSIEEIQGSIFDDAIIGGNADEYLEGRNGNDLIVGNDGNDALRGGDGNDTLDGGVGGDYFQPGLGSDVIFGGPGGVLFEGDELSYRSDSENDGATSGVQITFTNDDDGSVIDYGGNIDVFTGIDLVEGTQNNDTFIGAEGFQEFRGFGGDDFFDGGAGDNDEIDYRFGGDQTGLQGIVVDMAAGTAIDKYGDTDTFVNIERIEGSLYGDTITGNSERNELRGREGDDLIDSFGGQDNNLDGGRGNDTLNARGDSDFASGGDGNDLITFFGEGGNANPGLGSDTITGGTDGFFSIGYRGVANDLVIDVEAGTTTIQGTTDVDSFTNIVNIEGGEGNDTLLGNDGERQEFFTSLGDDFIDGRGDENDGLDAERDWLIYNWYNDEPIEQRAMVVNFETGTATGVLAGNDTFVNIEAVRGSRADDLFIGSDQLYEEFQGMEGSDTIEGGGGLDRISYSFEDNRGGTQGLSIDLGAAANGDGYIEITDTFGDTDYISGIEQVSGSFFADVLSGDGDNNTLIGSEGNDTLDGRGGDDFFWGGQDIDSMTGGAGADAFGGFIDYLDGDTITDFSAEDSISIFDRDFNEIAANASIVGNELRLDTDGDGVAEATMTLQNGYNGPVSVTGGPIGGPVATVFSVEGAGLFTAVVDEGDVVANVTIKRTGDLTSSATVQVTMTGTGLNPLDATDVTTPFGGAITVSFAPGQDQIIYQIGIVDDLDVEAAEDLAFTLSNPTSDGAGGAEIDGGQTFVRVLNNDVPASVRVDGEKRNEDAGEIVFTISRTGDLGDAITVPYQITSAGGLQGAEADDLVGGLPQSGSVVIEAGASQATVTVEVDPDAVAELHDDIIATISVGADWPDGLSVSLAQATGSIRNDDGVPPVLPVGATGSNFGDPHIVTLDGLAYDFQAVGEFTLIEAVSGDPLDVQVRFRPVEGSEVASQTTAVATTVGSARVVVDVDGSSLVTVDGAAFDVSSAVGGVSVGDGDLYYDGEAMTLVYANGEQLRVDVFDGFLSTSVAIGSGRDVRGLLGDADGDASNDLALRDGTVLAQPVSFADLYGAYADDWRIDDAGSLFDYAAGQGTADFTDLTFPAAGLTLDDFPIEVVAAAEAAAAGITDPALKAAAVLDYLVSGNTDYVEAASVVDDALDDAVSATAPMGAPAISAGIGISVSDAEIVEGDLGDAQTVAFTVYRTGDLGDAVTLDYTLGGDVDASDFEAASAGSLSFAAGEASKVIAVEVTGDDVVEGNEVLEMAFSLTSSAQPIVISSTASVTIVNDDIQADEPPMLNEITGTNGSDRLRGTDGDDLITSLGGRFDVMRGLEGADVFVFGEETSNGRRERDVIRDFDVDEDQLLLIEGTSIASMRDVRSGVIVVFEEDIDILYLRGEGVSSDLVTVTYDDFG